MQLCHHHHPFLRHRHRVCFVIFSSISLSCLFLDPSSNPYSARASLTERIYPSMPISQAPLQPQQLPPPTNFQAPPHPSSGGLFIPPTMPSTLSNPNSNDVPVYTPTYQAPVAEPNPVPWNTYSTPIYDQQSNEQGSNNQTGLWGWISGNKMLATVVEKAKVIIENQRNIDC